MVNTSINNPAQNSKEVLYFILLLATNESMAFESATTAENTLSGTPLVSLRRSFTLYRPHSFEIARFD